MPGAIARGRSSVVFVGGFYHYPNVDAAVWLVKEILPRLRAHRPGVMITIVGSHPPEPVRSLAASDVVVTGRVPEVEPFLERAAVVIAPLRLGGGMRLKVLQAMAFGKAVVTTPRGADGLVDAPDPPPLVIAEAAAALADATARLLDNDAERHELGIRGHDFVSRHYSWAAHGARLVSLYRELSRTSNERPRLSDVPSSSAAVG